MAGGFAVAVAVGLVVVVAYAVVAMAAANDVKMASTKSPIEARLETLEAIEIWG